MTVTFLCCYVKAAALYLSYKDMSKRILGAIPDALHAQDALRPVHSFSGIVRHVHVHGAYPLALTAGDTFACIALDAEQGEVAHGF